MIFTFIIVMLFFFQLFLAVNPYKELITISKYLM